ncbi:hypothetical protein BC833DRAFT_607514 [Globomyces pollinis-pini]|nr:hypothetical protein BC833DRAFT_607514 [Globomyces pollinis-pini]
MSVKQAILLVTYRNEILEEYYNLIHEAEINREREHNAAILIQKIWRGKRIRMALKCLIFTTITIQRYFRGFLGRQKFRNSLIEKLRQERMSFFDYNACLIQKFWRGYYSRKVIFDFYRRREYIASIILKMQHVRAYLKVKQQEMTATKKSIQQKEISEKLDQLASTRHHLVGTLAIPGVYSNASPEAPLNDDILKSSSGLQSCLDAIGKNIKGVIIKPPTNYLNPEDVRKITQGPFLPKYILKRTKLKPLNPTLRVETNFYDTRDALKEESRKDVSLRRKPHKSI